LLKGHHLDWRKRKIRRILSKSDQIALDFFYELLKNKLKSFIRLFSIWTIAIWIFYFTTIKLLALSEWIFVLIWLTIPVICFLIWLIQIEFIVYTEESQKPKKHHYVPASYLARFTEGNTKTSPLWVLDIPLASINKNNFGFKLKTPKSTAKIHSFYTLPPEVAKKIEGIDTGVAIGSRYFHEDVFSVLEGRAKLIIDKLIESETIPQNDYDFINLMDFIATSAYRTPWYRSQIDKMVRGFSDKDFKDLIKFNPFVKPYVRSRDWNNIIRAHHSYLFAVNPLQTIKALMQRKWILLKNSGKDGDTISIK
jgi:hypothetical protein